MAIGSDGTLYAGCATGECRLRYGPTGRVFALAGRDAPRMLFDLRLSAHTFRTTGPPSVCVAGRGCRPRAPLGTTLAFTATRPGVVGVTVRRADGRVVGRTFGPQSTGGTLRVQRGRRYYALLDALAGASPLRPGRYTVALTAPPARPRPLAFTVVR